MTKVLMSFLLMAPCLCFAANALNDDPVLPQPTGTYSVGYEDQYWLNQNMCPDPFYSPATAQDFSKANTQHCREMMVRVYYPSLAPKVMATQYDPSAISQYQQYISQAVPAIPTDLLNSLTEVQTWDAKGTSLATGTFPVVIFSPGDMTNENDYSSIIDEIVSQGYIVVALNNTFMSASVTFPDGTTVTNDGSTDQGRRTEAANLAVHEDAKFALSQIASLHQSDPVFEAMDLNHVALMGHSLGADVAMDLGHSNVSQLQAVIALDPCVEPWFMPSYQNQFAIPSLVMHTDTWFSVYGDAPANITIGKDNYFVAFSQMGHMNFSDEGLFQYQPAFQYAIQRSQDFDNQIYATNGYQLGAINGEANIQVINAYVVQFLNHYLKGQPLGWLANQKPYSPLVTGEYIGPATIDSNHWQNY